jgi:hypothetical protein
MSHTFCGRVVEKVRRLSYVYADRREVLSCGSEVPKTGRNALHCCSVILLVAGHPSM